MSAQVIGAAGPLPASPPFFPSRCHLVSPAGRSWPFLTPSRAAGIAPAALLTQLLFKFHLATSAPRGSRNCVGTAWHSGSWSQAGTVCRLPSGQQSWTLPGSSRSSIGDLQASNIEPLSQEGSQPTGAPVVDRLPPSPSLRRACTLARTTAPTSQSVVLHRLGKPMGDYNGSGFRGEW
jgi:hypothetical protein